jgi:hypothetical protein
VPVPTKLTDQASDVVGGLRARVRFARKQQPTAAQRQPITAEGNFELLAPYRWESEVGRAASRSVGVGYGILRLTAGPGPRYHILWYNNDLGPYRYPFTHTAAHNQG